MNTFYYNYNCDEECAQPRLLSESKTIKKMAKMTQSSTDFEDDGSTFASDDSSTGRKGTKYDTFDPEEREKIFELVKKACQGDLKAASSYKAPQYRELLKDIIPHYRPGFENASNDQMTRMWKKVKGIIASKSEKKSEKRGEPIILDHELPEFIMRMKAIITEELTTKNLEAFREKLLPVIEDIRTRGGRKFDDNVFKKHKLSDFLKEHPEIKALWNTLKRSSNKNSKNTKIEEEEPTTVTYESVESSDRVTMVSEVDYSESFSSPLVSVEAAGEIFESNSSVEEEHEAKFSHEDDFGCITNIPDFLARQASSLKEVQVQVQTYDIDCFFDFSDSNKANGFQVSSMEKMQEMMGAPTFGDQNCNVGVTGMKFGRGLYLYVRDESEEAHQREHFGGLMDGRISLWDNVFTN